MSFTIRVLLLIIFLVAIIVAAFLSEGKGKRIARVASIDFSPTGEQFAVSVLECDAIEETTKTTFDRTISIVEFPALKTKSVVRRDRQLGNDLQNGIFWHSQANVMHTGNRILFLNRDQTSLLIKNLTTGDLNEIARFDDGQFYGFSVSNDSQLMLIHGVTNNQKPVAVIGSIEFEEQDLISVPLPDNNSNNKIRNMRSDGPQNLPQLGNRKLEQRLLVVPRDKSDSNDSDSIGVVSAGFRFERSAQTLKVTDALPLVPNPGSFEGDLAVSRGPCRFASILHNRLTLNVTSDRLPDDTYADVNIRLSNVSSYTGYDSVPRVALTRQGNLVAAAMNRQIKLLDTTRLESAPNRFRPTTLLERDIPADQIKTLEHHRAITAIAFSPDDQHLVVGDDRGRLTVYDVATGNAVSTVRAANKPRGVPTFVVLGMLAVWLWVAVLVFRKDGSSNRDQPFTIKRPRTRMLHETGDDGFECSSHYQFKPPPLHQRPFLHVLVGVGYIILFLLLMAYLVMLLVSALAGEQF